MVAKTGSVLHVSDVDTMSVLGDYRNALGIIEYLRDQGHDVLVFGQHVGNVDGVTHIRPDIRGLDDLSLVKDADRAYSNACDLVARWAPEVCVNIAGMTPSVSYLGNPRRASTRCFAVKYVAPTQWVIQHLALRRILVVNDFRCYPREQEMLYWPHLIPHSILSQEERTFSRKILDHRFEVRAVNSGAENWWSYGIKRKKSTGELDCVVIANAWPPKRVAIWETLLTDRCTVYGKGWPDHTWIQPGEVLPMLARARCGVVIPPAEGFRTSKPRKYCLMGALPLLYAGPTLAYPGPGPTVRNAKELDTAIDNIVDLHHLWIDYLNTITEPDFTLLNRALAGERIGGFYDA